MNDGFRIPAGSGESELTEKRSRFLAHLRTVETEDEAKAFIQAMKREFHDARHNCWCYRIHPSVDRFSDDGEPSGSAGMPMLEVFRREEVFNLVCVVTRYFGGVLLGTGGLSRAYSGAAKQALTEAGTVFLGRRQQLSLQCPYALSERIRSLISSAGAEITGFDYGEAVCMTVLAPDAEMLAQQIRELSGGRVSPSIGETVYGGLG
ncbi:MAG: YigZ family protein [Oscillospiraceae bacterium]|nr:YigZ family protein [Oscillospiraceae bacterium]